MATDNPAAAPTAPAPTASVPAVPNPAPNPTVPAIVPAIVPKVDAPAVTAPAIVAPAATAAAAPAVNTVAAAKATTPTPIATALRIFLNSDDDFFLNSKEYLFRNPSEIKLTSLISLVVTWVMLSDSDNSDKNPSAVGIVGVLASLSIPIVIP
nr:MAG TPA: hypothetical protein [Bacteriophage sp.]